MVFVVGVGVHSIADESIPDECYVFHLAENNNEGRLVKLAYLVYKQV